MVTLDANGKVTPTKAMLYKTAHATQKLVDWLPKEGDTFSGVSAGRVVGVRYAWLNERGEPVYFFGLKFNEWLGVAPESMFVDFVL